MKHDPYDPFCGCAACMETAHKAVDELTLPPNFTLPAELEFDAENHGNSNKPGYGILAGGRSSRIHIEGCEDDAIALSKEVVRRWNAHADLCAALEAIIAWETSEDGPFAWEVLGQARAALAKARGEVA